MECAEPLRREVAHPTSVLELTKKRSGESSMSHWPQLLPLLLENIQLPFVPGPYLLLCAHILA